MKISVVIFAVLLMLTGCASQSSSLQYYLLHSPADTVEERDNPAAVTIDQLLLPEYLKQRSLAIQTGPTTLHFSPRHVWAEPISNSFVQALSTALTADGVNVLPQGRRSFPGSSATLSIQIDDMISTWQGEVILKGRFWLDTPESAGVSQHFDYRVPLQQDGFAHAVESMRSLVTRLSANIASQVKS